MSMNERFFILTPRPVEGREVLTGDNKIGPPEPAWGLYLDASNREMRWSGRMPIPPIGAIVNVTMNGIGPSRVEGFFESCGFVGLMIKPQKPPKYYRQNTADAKRKPNAPNWQKEGIGCVFGNELAPTDGRKVAQ